MNLSPSLASGSKKLKGKIIYIKNDEGGFRYGVI